MAQLWSVRGHRIDFERSLSGASGTLSIDGVVDANCHIKRSRPRYEFMLDGGWLKLQTAAGVGELWIKGLLIPELEEHCPPIGAAAGTLCVRHPAVAAVNTCAQCEELICDECHAVDGTHCVKCMGQVTERDMVNLALAGYSGPGDDKTFLQRYGRRFAWRLLLVVFVVVIVRLLNR